MPVYAFKGINAAGKPVNGTRDADSPRTIKSNLRKEGIFLTDLNEARSTKEKKSGGGGCHVQLRSGANIESGAGRGHAATRDVDRRGHSSR